jgi:hypothetical protein
LTYNDDRVDDKEELSRFAIEKSHFRSSDRTVKPKAFDPQIREENGRRLVETSMFRTTGLTCEKIWEIGDSEVGRYRRKIVVARSAIFADMVRDVGLTVSPDEPPKRHAVIVGWPDEEDEREKLLKQLAAAATLYTRENG